MIGTMAMSIYGSALTLLLVANTPALYPPIDVVTGMDSQVERASVDVATTPEQWNAVWQRHKGITPIGNTKNLAFPSIETPPTVDFTRNEVLVIFGGLAPQGGYQIIESAKMKKQIVVRIRALSTTLGGGASRGAFRANPFLFAIYKKTKLPFAIQMEQPDQNGAPQWQTVATAGG